MGHKHTDYFPFSFYRQGDPLDDSIIADRDGEFLTISDSRSLV